MEKIDGQYSDTKCLLEMDNHGIASLIAYLYKRSVIVQNNICFSDLEVHEDDYFQNMYLNSIDKIYMLHGRKYWRLMRANSTIHSRRNPFADRIRLYYKLFELYTEKGWINNGVVFFSLRHLASIMHAEDYYEFKKFVVSVYPFMQEHWVMFSDVDQFIAKAFIEDLPQQDFIQKYTENIAMLFYLRKLHDKVRKG